MKLINEKETEHKFIIFNKEIQKVKIDHDKLDSYLINSFYHDYFKSIDLLKNEHSHIEKDSKHKYHNLFYGLETIQNYIKYIKYDKKINQIKYIYDNSEKDYNFIKKLCFALLYYYQKK